MNNLKKCYLTLLILFAQHLVYSQSFKIEGKTVGFTEGTWLYISAGIVRDSAQVKNNKFIFNGRMQDKAMRAIVYTQTLKDYRSFWIEPTVMKLLLKKGAFQRSRMRGSKTQLENQKLSDYLRPTEDSEKQLEIAYKATTNKILQKEIYDKATKIEEDRMNIQIRFIENHPKSIVAADLLVGISPSIGNEKTKNLYEKLAPTFKDTYYGQEIRRFLQVNKQIRIGQSFIDFEQPNTQDEILSLSKLRAKYTLLEFWGSWCTPCRKENPNLVKLYSEYKQKGFTIVGVAADFDKQKWLSAVKEDHLTWQNLSDLKGNKNLAAIIYGIDEYPTNYLIDESGIIIEKNITGELLSEKLKKLLP
jgi:peroxiredoxin